MGRCEAILLMGIDVRRPILALRLSPSGSSLSSTSSPAFSRRLWRLGARLLTLHSRARDRGECLHGCAGSRRQAPLRRTCQHARVQSPRTKPGVIRLGRRHVVIAASFGWLWMVEGQRPTGSDVLGALLEREARRIEEEYDTLHVIRGDVMRLRRGAVDLFGNGPARSVRSVRSAPDDLSTGRPKSSAATPSTP
jgi:hypothetical protein